MPSVFEAPAWHVMNVRFQLRLNREASATADTLLRVLEASPSFGFTAEADEQN